MKVKCPICGYPNAGEEFTQSTKTMCPRCGEFSITGTAIKSMPTLSDMEIQKISGWLRENQGFTIRHEDLDDLRRLPMPTVGEKAGKLLTYFGVTYPKPGEHIKIVASMPRLQAVCWAADQDEVSYLVNNYLTEEKSYLQRVHRESLDIRITPSGWSHLDSLRQRTADSKVGFIAMWFSEDVADLLSAIREAISAAGYEPLRIDQRQHNNKIDDEIIAAIRRSKFIVADFTGQRGGVYFEAGFAKGLGLEVIWLCEEGELATIHFDTRQYNFIKWSHGNLPDLKTDLQNRIEATIGRGR